VGRCSNTPTFHERACEWRALALIIEVEVRRRDWGRSSRPRARRQLELGRIRTAERHEGQSGYQDASPRQDEDTDAGHTRFIEHVLRFGLEPTAVHHHVLRTLSNGLLDERLPGIFCELE
jgi:hypothetical protein